MSTVHQRMQSDPTARQGARVRVFHAAPVWGRYQDLVVRLPDAPRGYGLGAREMSELRDAARAVQTEPPERSAYVCPMHPEVTDSKPGTCPKCGMKLVLVQVEATEPSFPYVCPMHPRSHGLEARYLPEVRG